MHAVPASLKGQYVIRFTVTSPRTTANDITRDWQLIRTCALDLVPPPPEQRTKMKLKGERSDKFVCMPLPSRSLSILSTEIRERNKSFGTSLLLANIGPNSPMTPKIVNGSYAALFENTETTSDFSNTIMHIKKEIEGQGKRLVRTD